MSNGDAMRPYAASWAHFAIPLAHRDPSPTPTSQQVSEAAGFLVRPSLAPSPAAPCEVTRTTACQATAVACKPEGLIGLSRAY